jgi:crotonobetainyl-CoA:carnitine CoA-transferase CaiB-like acyl-CoA transferase
VPGQEGNHHPTQVPMGAFQSADGLVNVAASSHRMWTGFCTALGAEHLLKHPDYADPRSRARHKEQLRADVNEVTKRFTTADLVVKLNAAGVPCGPINTIGTAFEDEQVRHLRMTKVAHHPTLGDISLLRSPINLSDAPQPAEFHHAAPDTGQDTDEILRDAGISDEEIARLRAEGVIA